MQSRKLARNAGTVLKLKRYLCRYLIVTPDCPVLLDVVNTELIRAKFQNRAARLAAKHFVVVASGQGVHMDAIKPPAEEVGGKLTKKTSLRGSVDLLATLPEDELQQPPMVARGFAPPAVPEQPQACGVASLGLFRARAATRVGGGLPAHGGGGRPGRELSGPGARVRAKHWKLLPDNQSRLHGLLLIYHHKNKVPMRAIVKACTKIAHWWRMARIRLAYRRMQNIARQQERRERAQHEQERRERGCSTSSCPRAAIRAELPVCRQHRPRSAAPAALPCRRHHVVSAAPAAEVPASPQPGRAAPAYQRRPRAQSRTRATASAAIWRDRHRAL